MIRKAAETHWIDQPRNSMEKLSFEKEQIRIEKARLRSGWRWHSGECVERRRKSNDLTRVATESYGRDPMRWAKELNR